MIIFGGVLLLWGCLCLFLLIALKYVVVGSIVICLCLAIAWMIWVSSSLVSSFLYGIFWMTSSVLGSCMCGFCCVVVGMFGM